ncbi:MAG: quinolinate synthase NadA [Candidatus Latescibacteria bacterium]|nr:quinolinate synthase NadA [Candidatus Latescibacterota bacterium]NIM66357.1 quinolinate synthase NadA [Candidatus Latescibacterota bacterium]NIO02836.1 quinolinate synthase NadA [Candidatus Latescibacterota bacterium]NIO29971.1 quinolinate synthase NadA [Candidatus Latescibacterota bacterium]NIO57586.1 quinolinate synthase NadA [Candidatus Latescibacterota bacterium]
MSVISTRPFPPILPDRILGMTEEEQIDRIRGHKARLGKKLVILGHHYQRESIIGVSDFVGDSFGLSASAASQKNAKHIIFCGVHFMAESARVLASPSQRVFQPNLTAGCPMADMADIDDVEVAWESIQQVLGSDAVIPITYMNSSADIKAFCGRNGGAVCTSSNAGRVFEWALDKGRKIIFFPDEHLGRNTANALGIPKRQQILWNPNLPNGGNSIEDIRNAVVTLWKGFCHVHTHYTVEHIREARKRYPNCKIVVHPECKDDVVAEADEAGSTSFICSYVEQAASGATILIATEVNLTTRLAHEYPDKTILPVSRSLCHNMYRINPGNLLYTLDNLGKVNEVFVDPEVLEGARLALQKMLELAQPID